MTANSTPDFLFRCPDLKELYSQKYDEKMTQWRALCAIEKASNVESMVSNMRGSIEHVLDVGCGTGAVLEQLAAKKVGTSFTGIEIGTGAFSASRKQRHPDSWLRRKENSL